MARVQELASLRATLASAAAGQPTITIVEGDAGIGKSRLVSEFSRRARLEGAFTMAGGCPATGLETEAFGPIAEALRMVAPQVDGEILRTMSRPSADALVRLVPSLESPPSGDGASTANGRPGAMPDDQLAPGRLLEAILDFLGRLGGPQAVLLSLEDLQWADRSTLAFLAFLSRNLRSERLLVVGTVRTDDLVPGDPVARFLTELARSGMADRISLSGLDRPATRTLVEAILGRVPDEDLVDVIHARSDGNPFYVEELLGSSPDVDALVSPTLRDIVSGRLALLSDSARRTLRAASVAGAEIDPTLLSEATGLDEREIETHLREGLEQHFLSISGEDPAFRHALVREILYSDLLSGERRAIHSRMAQAIEATGARDPRTAAALARHWDAGGHPERAFRAHLVAAELARATSAAGAEQQYLERAIELASVIGPTVGGIVDLVALRRQAADAALIAGDFRRAVDLARSALDNLPDDVDARTRGDHVRLLAHALLESGDLESATLMLEDAVTILSGPPSIELARALALLARIAMTGGSPDGPARAAQARDVARAVGAPAIEADATNTLGVLLRLYDDPTKSMQPLRDALQIARDAGDLYGILRAENNLSTALDQVEGRTREGLELARDGLETAERAGLQRTWGTILATTVAEQSYRLGEWDAVEAIAGPAIAPALRGGFLVGPLFHLARVRLARGDFDDAERWLNHIRTVGVGSLYVVNQGAWWVVMAGIELMRGRLDAAADAVQAGLELMTGTTVPWPTGELTAIGLRVERERAARDEVNATRASALIERARALASTSPRLPPMGAAWLAVNEAEWTGVGSEPSPAAWSTAVECWRRLQWPYEEARARLAEAEALLYSRRPRVEAGRTLTEAARISRRLGAAPLLREIELLARRAGIDSADVTVEEQGPDRATEDHVPLAVGTSPRRIHLSPRETEVLRLVAAGRTNGEIGRELFVTTKTASSHVAHILDKLGVSSRTEAAVVAERLGLLGGIGPPAPMTSDVGLGAHRTKQSAR